MPVLRYQDVAAEPWRPGQVVRAMVSPAQGAPNLSVQHFVVEPGSVVPLHTHDVEEAIVVLAGMLSVRIGTEWSEAQAETVCVFPAGTPHAFRGGGEEPAQILTLFPIPAAITPEHTTYLEGGPPLTWE